jgi:ABC-type multidrug transport system fused ATPase/permease subunit
MRMGEEALATWLLAPSAVEQIRERHAAIGELRDQLDFREDIAIAGEDLGVGVHPEPLQNWAEAPNRMGPEWIRWASVMLAILAVAGVVLWATLGIATPFIVVLATEAILSYVLRNKLKDVLHNSEKAFRDLSLLSGILARFEQHTFSTTRLQVLQRELWAHGVKSSRAIAHLNTLVDLADSQSNMLVAILDTPLMYSVQVAFATERWRRAYGNAVRTWLSVIGEMEALLSLATYSYEHPDDPFPEFNEGATCFDAIGIGHPLIPPETCVRNDVRLSDRNPVMLVSGSNMSGKSTLLRTGASFLQGIVDPDACAHLQRCHPKVLCPNRGARHGKYGIASDRAQQRTLAGHV